MRVFVMGAAAGHRVVRAYVIYDSPKLEVER